MTYKFNICNMSTADLIYLSNIRISYIKNYYLRGRCANGINPTCTNPKEEGIFT